MEVVGNVTIIRRGLVLAWDLGGVESITSFGTKLGVSIGVAKQVVEVLKRDGFFKESQSMMYSFVTAKRQSPQFKYWMSDASLPMVPIPDVDADLCEVEDEFEESQVILGRPIVSSGFSTRTPPATVGRTQDQVQRMDFEGGVSGLVLDGKTSIQQVLSPTFTN
ncbi:hypothetical protein BCR33DRAFT_714869 [Rhizoclosmatium globosum]|uniref:Uncharacterized protein n=1 Tax=Rhizoclosmatium globosum TaxID=329046 RepID=A0A1Y2CLF2_9FUNG|nr:hypothetical protein BCR33DRAFT_714869 [Rhizoclosmatium globosum]|eukprot:ORY47806.1 hypothetical protein BCR33DRAFT_714869 [Rhizoclosmatium globosum]